MRHADEATLRRLLDEPDAVPSEAQRHIQSCVECQGKARAFADEGRAVASALGAVSGDATSEDATRAYARFAARTSPTQSVSMRERLNDLMLRRRPYVMVAGSALAAALLFVVLAFTPVGTLAQNFLTIFEPHQFIAINISKGELQYLPDLQSFGTMTQQREPDHRQVASTAQARALTGIPVRMPSWVPASVPRELHVDAISRGSVSFTFSAAKARAYAAQARRPIPAMPRGLDGSTMTLNVGPMVVVTFGAMPPETVRHSVAREHGRDEGPDVADLPQLVVVQSAAPHVYSTGVNVRELESYLLAMPGVPSQLADEIRAIGDPSTTMPIPVPVDRAYSQAVVIDGANGLAIGDNTGVGGMIVWQKNGIVYGVGGELPQRELMEIAQSLR